MNAEVTLTAVWARRIGMVRADLLYIADRWPDLYQLRMPGSKKPWRPGGMSAEAREQKDALARIEKAEQGDSVLGESRAPMDVDVLDTLSDILVIADDLAGRIAEAAGAITLDPPSTAYDFDAIGDYLKHISVHLVAAAENDHEALDDAQETARRMRTMLEAGLGEISDGQRLTTVCAWCHGSTPDAPIGGIRTLVVRMVVEEPVIVCENELCSPPDADCGTWVRGRPAWRTAEWEWLSKRLEAAGGQGRMAS